MEEIKYWIWFSRIENLTPKLQLDLLQKFNTPQKLWNKKEEELIAQGISDKNVKKICDPKYKKDLDKYLEYMQKNKIELINIYSKEYPSNLKQIYDPPVFLYIKGNKEILNKKSISIVGCRDCTAYGRNTAIKFAYNLSNNNINIVSGLARGIDAYSQRGVIMPLLLSMSVTGGIAMLFYLFAEPLMKRFLPLIWRRLCLAVVAVFYLYPFAYLCNRYRTGWQQQMCVRERQ